VIGDVLAGFLAGKGLARRGYGGEKTRSARGHRAAGLKTAATTGEKQVPRSARDDMAHWRPSTKVKEHKQERSLERLVDMGVSRKKDWILGFLGDPRRRRGALLNKNIIPER
jgi:hypothetical protein